MTEKITIYDVAAGKLNEKLAEALKSIPEFKMPEWANFVKTSVAKSRPPQDEDWWYKRAASILRQIYIRGVVGVNRLKSKYGGKKQRGAKPEKFRKASGKIIRVILQQAGEAELIEKAEGKKKGRQLTKKGLEFMNNIAKQIKGVGEVRNGKENESKEESDTKED